VEGKMVFSGECWNGDSEARELGRQEESTHDDLKSKRQAKTRQGTTGTSETDSAQRSKSWSGGSAKGLPQMNSKIGEVFRVITSPIQTVEDNAAQVA
jgi:hypothetical protein